MSAGQLPTNTKPVTGSVGASMTVATPHRAAHSAMRESNPRAVSSNDLPLSDLENGDFGKSVYSSGSATENTDCPSLAPSDISRLSPSLKFIAARWPYLQPHLREALVAFVDCASSQQMLDGGRP